MPSERIDLHVQDGLATLTLNRPEKHNGVDLAMLDAVIGAQKQIAKRRDVRALILRGAGPSFCAGIDAKAMFAGPTSALLAIAELARPTRNRFQRWSMGWRELGVPVIAAIHGNCFGAGLQLALGADIRIAAPSSKLSIMEARLGLVPDMGGPTLLRELVRIDVAKELTFSGRIVSGDDGLALGLVTHVDEDPHAAAQRLAREFATRSPDALRAGKDLLQRAYGASSEWAALVHERIGQLRVIGRKNQRLAMQDSQKKRAPKQDAAQGASRMEPRS